MSGQCAWAEHTVKTYANNSSPPSTHALTRQKRMKERKKFSDTIFVRFYILDIYVNPHCYLWNIKSLAIKKIRTLCPLKICIGSSFNGVIWSRVVDKAKQLRRCRAHAHTSASTSEDTNEMYDLIWLRKIGTFHSTTGYAQLDAMHTCSSAAWLTWLVWYAFRFSYWINVQKN